MKQKISLEDEYGLLDNSEREFCLGKGVSPKDFYNLKRLILKEQALDPKFSHERLKLNCEKVAENPSSVN